MAGHIKAWIFSFFILTVVLIGYAADAQYAYMVQANLATYTVNTYSCAVNSNDGSFSSCQNPGGAPSGGWPKNSNPFQVVLNSANPSYLDVIFSSGQGYDSWYLYQCSFTGQTLQNCQDIHQIHDGEFFKSAQTLMTKVGSQSYAYVAVNGDPGLSSSSFIAQCAINADGTWVTPCTGQVAFAGSTVPSLTQNSQLGIAFAAVGGTQYAYVMVVNPSPNPATSNNVYQCSMSTDGSTFTCNPQNIPAGSVTGPYRFLKGLAVGTINKTPYLFLATTSSHFAYSRQGPVYACPINGDGSLGSCGNVVNGSSDVYADSITATTINGTPYLYLIYDDSAANLDTVSACALSVSGNNVQLTNCTVPSLQQNNLGGPIVFTS